MSHNKKIVISICVLLHIFAFWLNYVTEGAVDMYTRHYGNVLLYLLESVSGSLVCVLSAQLICEHSSIFTNLCKEFFIWLGNNTIIYYVLHTMVYVILRNIGKIVAIKYHNQTVCDLLLNPVFNVIFAILLIYIINVAVIKHAPMLIGKEKK